MQTKCSMMGWLGWAWESNACNEKMWKKRSSHIKTRRQNSTEEILPERYVQWGAERDGLHTASEQPSCEFIYKPSTGMSRKGGSGSVWTKSITLSQAFFLLNLYFWDYNYIISPFLFLSPTPPFLPGFLQVFWDRIFLTRLQTSLKLHRSFCLCLILLTSEQSLAVSDLFLLSVCN